MNNKFITTVSLLLIALALHAQTEQITSITFGVGNEDALPNILGVTKDFVYLEAKDPFHGSELWRTDGTEAGTYRIADIFQGKSASMDADLFGPVGTVLGDTLYFVANNGIDGQQVWKSDGTEAGTIAITDFGSGTIGNIIETEGTLFFFHYNVTTDISSLWKSDGTKGGTQIVIPNLVGDTRAYRLFAHNGFIYFWLNNGNANDLWVSDGSPEGSTLILNDVIFSFNGPYNNNTLAPLYPYNGKLYGIFSTLDFPFKSIYQIDETTVTPIFDAPGNSFFDFTIFISDAVELNDLLYFYLYDSDNESILLIETDGTRDSTQIILAGFSGAFSDPANASNIIAMDSLLVFSYFGDNPSRTELISFNPKTKDLTQLGDVGRTVGFFEFDPDIAPIKMYQLNERQAIVRTLNQLFLLQDNTLTDLNQSVYILARTDTFQNQFLFASGDDETTGIELWRFNASDSLAHQVVDINQAKSSNIQSLQTLGEQLYFTATTSNGQHLFSSNGAKDETQNLTQGTEAGGDIFFVTGLEDKLLFMNDPGGSGDKLWSIQGDSATTFQIIDMDTTNHSSFFDMVRLGNKLYFGNRSFPGPTTIFETDGSSEGTQPIYSTPLLDSNSNTYLSVLALFGLPNGLAIEVSDRSVGNHELLILNPLDNPTPKSILQASNIFQAVGSTNKVYYHFRDTVGEALPNIGFYDLNDQSSGILDFEFHNFSNIRLFTTLGDLLIFQAFSPDVGEELWITNGTDIATFTIDINDGPNSGFTGSKSIVNTGDYIYFAAKDEANGMELWRYDGSFNDPELLDIVAGSASSNPVPLAYIDSLVYFTAYTSSFGRELWQTDGTLEATKLVVDILEGPISSSPRAVIKIENTLYLEACTESDGEQIWRFDVITGIKERILPSVEVGLFPNPVETSFQLSFSGNAPMHALIYSLDGQLIRQIPNVSSNQSIRVDDLSAGRYTLKLIGRDGWGQASFIKN